MSGSSFVVMVITDPTRNAALWFVLPGRAIIVAAAVLVVLLATILPTMGMVRRRVHDKYQGTGAVEAGGRGNAPPRVSLS